MSLGKNKKLAMNEVAEKRFDVLKTIKYRVSVWLENNPNVWFAVVIAATILIFWPTIVQFFAIDDFVWLWVGIHSNAASWKEAFTHINGSGQYRPLSQQVFFWFGYHLFGINPLGFHLLNLAIFLLACWFCYRLLLKLTSSPKLSALALVFFSSSVVHFDHLIWVSAVTETLATLCVAASLYYCSQNKKIPIALWYIIGLMSNETTIIIPVMATVFYLIYKKYPLIKSFKETLYLWVIFVIYALLRLEVFGGLADKGVFAPSWSVQVWLSEIKNSLLSSLGFNATMTGVYNSTETLRLLILFIAICSAILVIYQAVKNRVNYSLVTLGLSWFLIGLLPVLPFAHNFSIYTVSIPALGLPFVMIGLLGSGDLKKFYFVSAGFVIISIVSLYGPNGLYSVDGLRLLSRGDHSAFIQMQAEESRIYPQPLVVSVIGPSQAFDALGNQWTARVVNNGSKTIIGDSPNANLKLEFDPSTLMFRSP